MNPLITHAVNQTVILRNNYTIKGVTIYYEMPYGTKQYYGYPNGAGRVYLIQTPDGWRQP